MRKSILKLKSSLYKYNQDKIISIFSRSNKIKNTKSTMMLGSLLGFGLMTYFNQNLFLNNKEIICAEAKEQIDPYTRTRAKTPLGKDAVILSGNSNKQLAEKTAELLGCKVADGYIKRFADGEVYINIFTELQGKHCYIIQSTCAPVNDNLVELILMISACKRSGAASVTCVIPYYGYARQDRKSYKQSPISASDVGFLLEKIGASRIISVDLHCSQAQGFVSPNVVFDNLEGGFIGLDYFLKEIPNKSEIVIVSPDAGGMHRAKAFHEHFEYHGYTSKVGLAMINKERKEANQISSMELIGNVEGKTCIIVDDMIDTAGTLCEAAQLLKEKGAQKVYAFASHGLFSGPAADRIANSHLEKVLTLDSIPLKEEFKLKVGQKHGQLSLDLLLAESIRRVHNKESLKELFEIPVY